MGGGVKQGFVWGETDEPGVSIVRDPVHVYDLRAMVLHLRGFDHERLTDRFQAATFGSPTSTDGWYKNCSLVSCIDVLARGGLGLIRRRRFTASPTRS